VESQHKDVPVYLDATRVGCVVHSLDGWRFHSTHPQFNTGSCDHDTPEAAAEEALGSGFTLGRAA
jgi:hypothetical protein